MIRKNAIVAALATFCLTVTLFSVIRAGGYDPWADINDDGKIDMKDIATVASQFSTAGDSTKNVTVKDSVFSWFSGEQYISQYAPWSSSILSTAGFRQFTVHIQTNSTNSTIYVQFIQENAGVHITSDRASLTSDFTGTYNVVGTGLTVSFVTYLNSTVWITCSVYMNSIPVHLPSYTEQSFYVNVSSGSVGVGGIDCGGYSRLAMSVDGGSASSGTYVVTLYMYAVAWSTSWEFLSADALNVTFNVKNGYAVASHPPVFITETKARWFWVDWTVLDTGQSLPQNWWINFQVYTYLRNE